MSESLRWKLCLGCFLLVALQAPQVGLLVLEDLAGPYSAHEHVATANRTAKRAEDPRRTAALAATVQEPVFTAGLAVLGLHDLTAQSAPSSTPNPYVSESRHDLSSNAQHAGWFIPSSP